MTGVYARGFTNGQATSGSLDPQHLDRFRVEGVSRHPQKPIPADGLKLKPLRQGEMAQPDPGRVEHRPGLREDRGVLEARVEEAEGLLRKDARPDPSRVIQQKSVEKRLVCRDLRVFVESREQQTGFLSSGAQARNSERNSEYRRRSLASTGRGTFAHRTIDWSPPAESYRRNSGTRPFPSTSWLFPVACVREEVPQGMTHGRAAPSRLRVHASSSSAVVTLSTASENGSTHAKTSSVRPRRSKGGCRMRCCSKARRQLVETPCSDAERSPNRNCARRMNVPSPSKRWRVWRESTTAMESSPHT